MAPGIIIKYIILRMMMMRTMSITLQQKMIKTKNINIQTCQEKVSFPLIQQQLRARVVL